MNLPIIALYALSNGMILIVVLLASAIRVKLERACHRQTVWFVVFRNNENKNIYTVVGGEWRVVSFFPVPIRIPNRYLYCNINTPVELSLRQAQPANVTTCIYVSISKSN